MTLKLNKEQAQEIIDLFVSGNTIKQLSKKFATSSGNIRAILLGITWKDCVRPDGIKETITNYKITQKIAQEIIDAYVNDDNATYKSLGKQYGLWDTQIGNVVKGKNCRGVCWKKCVRPPNIDKIINLRAENNYFQKGHNDEIHATYPPLTDLQKNIITGSLLGDACISKFTSTNSNLHKGQCKKFKEYVVWHYEQLKPYGLSVDEIYSDKKLVWNKNTNLIERIQVENRLTGYSIRTCHHPVFTKLRKLWYPNGIKIIPNNLVLTPQAIAVWFCDDGVNSMEQRSACFCTESFTFDEAEFLCEKLADFDIEPKINTKTSKKTGRKQPFLKIYSDSYDNLINLVKPFIKWECFAHKIAWRKSTERWEYCNKLTDEQAYKVLEMRKEISSRKIAEHFGVHPNVIYYLIAGQTYKHIPREDYKYNKKKRTIK